MGDVGEARERVGEMLWKGERQGMRESAVKRASEKSLRERERESEKIGACRNDKDEVKKIR